MKKQNKTAQQFATQLQSDKYYTPETLDDFISTLQGLDVTKTNRKVKYFDVPCSFDIETTSFYQHDGKAISQPISDTDEKHATLYGWTFGLNGCVYLGRTWNDLRVLLVRVVDTLKLGTTRRLLCFVHNLAYEFQWIRKIFEWEKVFAVDTRKPVYAITTIGIEFRCSYVLSGYNLENLGKNLQKYKANKMVGDLDYTLLRHSKTPLTLAEIGYMVNDVKVVMAYVQELIEQYGNLTNLPLTNTGFVRDYCRNKCLYTDGLSKSKSKNQKKYIYYRRLMEQLTLSPELYNQLRRAFAGGFTHCNPVHSGKTVEDVTSFDFTSSYPAVMLSERFPMSEPMYIKLQNADDFTKYLKLYCCLFDARFIGLKPKTLYDNYISYSKCWDCKNIVTNNGRVVSGDISITLTEQDYAIIKAMYTWDSLEVGNLWVFKRDYLPRDFVLSILDLYEKKTTLKGVTGALDNGIDAEVEYLRSKGMLNSLYGMCVTSIDMIANTYENNEWVSTHPDLKGVIDKYNTSARRFLFYPWGVW